MKIPVFNSSILFGACFLGGALAEESKLSLLEFIPEDAPLLLHIENVEEVSKQWEDSPLGVLLKDEKVRAFIKPLMEKAEGMFSDMPGGDAVPEAFEKVREQFKGEIAFALVHAPIARWFKMASDSAEGVDDGDGEGESMASIMEGLPHLLLLGEVGDGTIFMKESDELMKTIQEVEKESGDEVQVFLEKETVEGVECRYLQIEEKGEEPVDFFSYGEAGGVAVFGRPKTVVLETLTALKKQDLGEPSVVGGSLADFRERFPNSSTAIHVNLESTLSDVFDSLQKAGKSGEIDMAPLEAMGMNMKSLWETVGLSDWRSLGFGLEFGENKTAINTALIFRRRSGVMSLLAYENGKIELPEFVPSQAPSVTISRFDVTKMWGELKTMLRELSPPLNEQFLTGLGDVEKAMEINFEKDLINHLGNEIVQIEDMIMPDLENQPEDAEVAQDNVIILELKNSRSFEIGVDKLIVGLRKRMGLPVGELEYLGRKMHVFGNPPNEVAFFVEGDHLYLSIGLGKMVRKILSTVDRPGDSFWKQPNVKRNIDGLEPGYCELSYVRLGKMVNSFVGMVKPVRDLLEDEDIPLDFDAMPSGAYFERLLGDVVGVRYMEKNGFFGRAILVPNK